MIEAARHSIPGNRRHVLGDVLRAYAALQPGDGAAEAQIARLLGFGLRQLSDATAASQPRQPQQQVHAPPPVRRPSVRPPDLERPEGRFEVGQLPPETIAPEPQQPRIPPPIADSHPFELRTTRRPARLRPGQLSLFAPHVQRALLSGLLARRSRTGAIDVDAVVARVANAQPIEHLPRLVRWSIRQSVHVLVDMGDGMQPFRRDQVQLLDTLRRLLGSHRLRVGTFRDIPQFGVRMGGAVQPFVPIPAGSILLLAAPGEDLSLDREGAIELWRIFLQGVKAAGGEATVLSPIASVRYEPRLGRLAALVTWDRVTGMGAVREARRRRARR